MAEVHFIPAAPGTNILAVYRNEDMLLFDVCKFPCLFYMVDNDRTVPMGLYDAPRGTIYIGLQHPDGRVSVAFDKIVYANEQKFRDAADAFLIATGMIPAPVQPVISKKTGKLADALAKAVRKKPRREPTGSDLI